MGTGVTGSLRATLSDGRIQHDAHIQTVDEYHSRFQTDRGIEINFRDSWKYNIAAYRLDKILDLNIIPVSIERPAAGVNATAVTWWLNGSMMELDLKRKHLREPDAGAYSRQRYAIKVFDERIYNTDRNLQNVLIDSKMS